MQTLDWYVRRLAAMSPGEVGWRLRSKAQEALDWCVARRRTRPARIAHIARGNGSALAVRGAALGDQCRLGDILGAPGGPPTGGCRSLVARAERFMQNRFDFFDLEDRDLGPRVHWNHEYAVGRDTPMGFAPRIDYRDFAVTGDAKVVWEPNRHQHLVALGRAFRLTGDSRYAEKVIEQIESWIDQCPFGFGMNWRSPLELAIRLINWVWALELIERSGELTKGRMAQILPVAHRHLWDISRKYSRYSSANNHLIGEAAGVYIGSTYFSTLRAARSRCEESRAILLREIESQTLGDGGHAELAVGYHQFVLQFFLLAGLVGRRAGDVFPAGYWVSLERMFEFLAALSEGGERPPMLNDCDDGYVLDFGSGAPDPAELLSVGAALFRRDDLMPSGGPRRTAVQWLLGDIGTRAIDELVGKRNGAGHPPPIRSRALSGSGIYLLQTGAGRDRISVSFDCGALGFGSIAAHGHADALGITLRAFGADVIVDPGTYDYFTYPTWRDYFRSTRAHNTITVDGMDQSEMLGLFLWGRRARATCALWEPAEDGGTVAGVHDGYSRLADPVEHRRTLTLHGNHRALVIDDVLTGRAEHNAAVCFHFAPQAEVVPADGNRFRVDFGVGTAEVCLDPRLTVRRLHGSEDPPGGWVSARYHVKCPATMLEAGGRWRGRFEVQTRITFSRKD